MEAGVSSVPGDCFYTLGKATLSGQFLNRGQCDFKSEAMLLSNQRVTSSQHALDVAFNRGRAFVNEASSPLQVVVFVM